MSGPGLLALLEYARFHGVACDHLASRSMDHGYHLACHSINHDDLLDKALDIYLQDPAGETRLSFEDALGRTRLQHEKLDIPGAGALFLGSVIQEASSRVSGSTPSFNEALPDIHRVRNLKIERPILATDHDLDMSKLRERTCLDNMDVDLPLEIVDENNDEGFQFPSYFRARPAQVIESLNSEKLDCTREVLLFIQEIRQMSRPSPGDHWENTLEETPAVKEKQVEPLSPPLLARELSPSPFVPSPGCMEIDMLSEPETPSMPEHNEVEQRLVEDVRLSPMDEMVSWEVGEACSGTGAGHLDDSISASASLASGMTAPRETRISLGLKSKLEGPITPPISAEKRRIQADAETASDILESIDISKWPTTDSTEPILSKELNDSLIKIANAAMRKLESKLVQERVHDIDVAMKCVVPRIGSPMIVPPWDPISTLSNRGNSKSHGNVSSLIQELKDGHILEYNFPSDNSNFSNIQWTIFSPSFSNLEVNEQIAEDNGFLSFLPSGAESELSCVEEDLLDKPTKSLLTEAWDNGSDSWLLPLDDHQTATQADNLTPQPKPCVKISSKRKRHNFEAQKARSKIDDSANIGHPTKSAPGSRPPGLSVPNSRFSALDSLSTFLQIRGKKAKRPRIGIYPYFSKPVVPNPMESPMVHEESITNSTAKPMSSHNTQNPPISTLLLPSPDISPPSGTLTLFVSEALLQTHRHLVRSLENLSPPCILIFRNYASNPATSTQEKPSRTGLVSPIGPFMTQSTDPLGHEADLIVSPTVGIILTTTQAIGQRYLPGHGSHSSSLHENISSPLHERIYNVSLRYEEVYVLIGHHMEPSPTPRPNSDGSSIPIDKRTFHSVQSLIEFSSSLSGCATVTPLLIPSRSESVLSWVLALANKHYVSTPWSHGLERAAGENHPELSATKRVPQPAQITQVRAPADDPTVWELFLRYAGLNPFAANIIIMQPTAHASDVTPLTYPTAAESATDVPKSDMVQSSQDNLSQFVAMHPRERRRQFVPVLGERTLARVELQLDGQWESSILMSDSRPSTAWIQ
ncbi:hypothetical protein AJ80_04947 [Polytolypa hystricis UAMH7299]|uniref:Uncharacterized protein n=1 Tax=Polytolypa hystricis (strain UAMH7299) TaxID=1447883 RepID=A0A2B7XZ43_POLH7|nr:hypothetical protein AJ80_04947 [Polytolypa hystricis UAMH7299]